jgi:hypothetical protein
MQTREFFQSEEKRCRENAERAAKTDQQSWLDLARRWDELSQARKRGSAIVEVVHTLRPERAIYNKKTVGRLNLAI